MRLLAYILLTITFVKAHFHFNVKMQEDYTPPLFYAVTGHFELIP